MNPLFSSLNLSRRILEVTNLLDDPDCEKVYGNDFVLTFKYVDYILVYAILIYAKKVKFFIVHWSSTRAEHTALTDYHSLKRSLSV